MRKVFCFFSLLLFCINSQSQKAYIQVKGEPDLEVYLNGSYKGTTSADIGGYIIENVTAGKNTIKIIKSGYAPYEETITVNAGEVLAYTVKPFAKHKVVISEAGNTQTTNKQKSLQTGKLIIQSVPIEIKLTIPDIEGVNNSSKTKDQWIAESIPSGSYTVFFSFNNKTYEKTVEILGNETTSVFANLLNGEITVKNSIEEKRAAEKISARKREIIDSVGRTYRFKFGMREADFRAYNPEAAKEFGWGGDMRKGKGVKPGVYYYRADNGVVTSYYYLVKGEGSSEDELYNFWKSQLNYFKKLLPEKELKVGDRYFEIEYNFFFTVKYEYCLKDKCYSSKSGFVIVRFHDRN